MNYRNHEIIVTDDLRFRVHGPEITLSRANETFDSRKDCQEIIDKAIRLAEKEATSKFSAHVLDETGQLREITGINRTNGNVRGLETKRFYPNQEWLATLLKEQMQATKTLAAMNATLKPFVMSSERAYGRIDPDEYTRKLIQLEKEVNEKQEASKLATAKVA